MGLKKTAAMTMSAAFIAIAGIGLAAVPASAAPANCAAGAGCVYGDTGFNGGWKGFQQYITDYADYNWSGDRYKSMDNDTSSLYNNGSTQVVYLYKDRNKGGASFNLGTKQYDSNLHDSTGVSAGFQDTIGSSYFKGWN